MIEKAKYWERNLLIGSEGDEDRSGDSHGNLLIGSEGGEDGSSDSHEKRRSRDCHLRRR